MMGAGSPDTTLESFLPRSSPTRGLGSRVVIRFPECRTCWARPHRIGGQMMVRSLAIVIGVVFFATPAAAEFTKCKLTYNLSGWSVL